MGIDGYGGRHLQNSPQAVMVLTNAKLVEIDTAHDVAVEVGLRPRFPLVFGDLTVAGN